MRGLKSARTVFGYRITAVGRWGREHAAALLGALPEIGALQIAAHTGGVGLTLPAAATARFVLPGGSR